MFENVKTITIIEENGKKLLESLVFIDEPVKSLKLHKNGRYRIRIDYNDDQRPKNINIEINKGTLTQYRKNRKEVARVNQNNNDLVMQPNPRAQTTILEPDAMTNEIIANVMQILNPIIERIMMEIKNLNEETKRSTLKAFEEMKKNPAQDFISMAQAFEQFQNMGQPVEENPKDNLTGGLLSVLPSLVTAFANKPQQQQPVQQTYPNLSGIEQRLNALESQNQELLRENTVLKQKVVDE